MIIVYKETFGIFDKNGDGVISVDELSSAIRMTGYEPSTEETQAMIARVAHAGLTFDYSFLFSISFI